MSDAPHAAPASAASGAPAGETGTKASTLTQRAKNPIRWGLIALLLPLGALLPIAGAVGIRVFAFEAFELDGPSMEPGLQHGDRAVVDKAAYGVFLPFADEALTTWAQPEPGEVVVIHSPLDDIDIMKRIIGVAGDTIEIRDDVVYRNGEPIARPLEVACEPPAAPDCVMRGEQIGARRWLTSSSSLGRPDSLPLVEVPEGHVFVLGDHRDRSNDSRNPRVGMIPHRRLKGRVWALYVRNGSPTWEGLQ